MQIRIQADPIDPGRELNEFAAGQDSIGAVVTFTGIVRQNAKSDLRSIHIEHYPGMTESAVEEIAEEARRRWAISGVSAIHRYGELFPGETIVMVMTMSKHRSDAFQAAEFLMDYLKSKAPFWKKECFATGEEWVDSRSEDDAAMRRWEGSST